MEESFEGQMFITRRGVDNNVEIPADRWASLNDDQRWAVLDGVAARYLIREHDIRWAKDGLPGRRDTAPDKPRRIAYDTEFIERGTNHELVSIGLVEVDSGRTYYGVSDEFNIGHLFADDWLRTNVAPALPWTGGAVHGLRELDRSDLAVKSRLQIARDVMQFIVGDGSPVELWAHFGAFDHVMLSGLCDLVRPVPPQIPGWTRELNHRIEQLGVAGLLPAQSTGRHNALEDARHLAAGLRLLDRFEANDFRVDNQVGK
ncbi:3'-5' exoribonuclease domain-containing protein [Krasilnikovia sp. MM14-A1259]|uniref:3'-5' exoribonuclease domain-containing protein n=1 Tax=Krasilnikovia sp. MM14-A1259 TaxID=3373539 RepID=UPI0037F341FF